MGFTRSGLARYCRAALGYMALASVLLFNGCAGSTPNPNPPPPVEKEAIIVTVNGAYDFAGGALTGTVTISGNGANVSGNIGSPLNLGDYAKGATLPFNIKLYATGALPIYYTSVPLSRTSTITGLRALPTSAFPIDTFIAQMTTNNMNSTCTSPKISPFYSSSFDAGHGPAFYTEVAKVAGWMGKPCDTAKAKDLGLSDVPPDGEYWSRNSPGYSGLTSMRYPKGGDFVTSAVMMYDQDQTPPVGLIREVVKLFKQNSVSMTVDEAIMSKFFSFAGTMRPQGTDKSYKIFADHEEMTGLPPGAAMQTAEFTTMTKYEAMPNPTKNATSFFGNSDDRYDMVRTQEWKEAIPSGERRYQIEKPIAPRRVQSKKI